MNELRARDMRAGRAYAKLCDRASATLDGGASATELYQRMRRMRRARGYSLPVVQTIVDDWHNCCQHHRTQQTGQSKHWKNWQCADCGMAGATLS